VALALIFASARNPYLLKQRPYHLLAHCHGTYFPRNTSRIAPTSSIELAKDVLELVALGLQRLEPQCLRDAHAAKLDLSGPVA